MLSAPGAIPPPPVIRETPAGVVVLARIVAGEDSPTQGAADVEPVHHIPGIVAMDLEDLLAAGGTGEIAVHRSRDTPRGQAFPELALAHGIVWGSRTNVSA